MSVFLGRGDETAAGEPAARVLLVGPAEAATAPDLAAIAALLRRGGPFEIVPAATLAAAAASIADRAPEVILLDAGLLDPAAPERDLRALINAAPKSRLPLLAPAPDMTARARWLAARMARLERAVELLRAAHPRYQGNARNIHAAAQHLIGVVNTLLDLAKAEAGQLTLHPEQVAIADLIRNTLALLAPQAEAAGIVLTAEIAADPPVIESDPGKLRQILIKLVSNAIRFTPAGGRVRVQTRHDATAGVLVLVVSDTGIGIAPEDIARIMQPYQQARQLKAQPKAQAAPHSGMGSGTGLGLPVTRATF